MYFICIQTLFSQSPSHSNLFLSITINHLAFKDKRRVLYPPSDTRSSCWCLGGSFKDVSSATLPAAELSQWRLLLCCLSVSGGGAAGMKSVSLDPQVTSSCSSPTRELTPAEWNIKPLLVHLHRSFLDESVLVGFWTMSGNTEAILFFITQVQQEDIDKALANILTKITLNHYFLVGLLNLKFKVVSILFNRDFRCDNA